MRSQRPSISMSYAFMRNRRNRVMPIVEVTLTPENSPSAAGDEAMSLEIIRAIAEGASRAQQLWQQAVSNSLETAADEVRHHTLTEDELDEIAPPQRFSKWLGIKEETCAICFVEFKRNKRVRQLPCNHAFCSSCISRWACESHSCCPVCRSDISSD